MNYSQFLDPEEAILVLGSINAKLEDRYIDRNALRSVQLITEKGIIPIDFFNTWGEKGVNAITWHPQDPLKFYISTGTDLIRFNLLTKEIIAYDIPNLIDGHEITVFDDTLWFSNTGMDEVIAFSISMQKVDRRINLQGLIAKWLRKAQEDKLDLPLPYSNFKSTALSSQIDDKFHCNQIIKGLDDEPYALVHHTSGKQFLHMVAQKLIKNHGNGGVIRLSDGQRFPLKLYAPHSIQTVGNQYWVFNSGNFVINVYDQNWKLVTRFPSQGWGRGADVSFKTNLYYAGISQTRKRYLHLIPQDIHIPNLVQIFDTNTYKSLFNIPIENVEQINNVYVINKMQKQNLLRLLEN